jgi:hypothetical protein
VEKEGFWEKEERRLGAGSGTGPVVSDGCLSREDMDGC